MKNLDHVVCTPGCSPVRDTCKTVQESTDHHAFVRGTEKSLILCHLLCHIGDMIAFFYSGWL